MLLVFVPKCYFTFCKIIWSTICSFTVASIRLIFLSYGSTICDYFHILWTKILVTAPRNELCSPVSFFSVRDRTRSSSFTHNSGFTGFQSLLGFNLLFKRYINNLHSLQDCFFCFWDTCNYLISL